MAFKLFKWYQTRRTVIRDKSNRLASTISKNFPFLLLLFFISSCWDQQKPKERPNILLIVADDMGYSDVGAYGGEISTPNIDGLAQAGLLFTQFHVAPNCGPTRGSMLTGVDFHKAGLGGNPEVLAENQKGKPGSKDGDYIEGINYKALYSLLCSPCGYLFLCVFCRCYSVFFQW